MSLEITYKKHSSKIFKELEVCIQIKNIQCYIPIYNRFFKLDETTWNQVQLNQPWELSSVQLVDPPIYEGTVIGKSKSKKRVDIFFKLSPLLDPLKYLSGSYVDYDFSLPTLTNSVLPKFAEINNSAYIDSFFSYLTSRLLEQGFIHGLDFYGSYLGIKENFVYNVDEDIEYLHDNDFFNANRNILFTCNFMDTSNNSRKYRERLHIHEDIILENIEVLDTTGSTIINCLEDHGIKEIHDDLVTDGSFFKSEKKDYIEDNKEDKEEDVDEDDEETEYDELDVCIKQFPVQVIALEACESTLDDLLEEDLPSIELQSALMQIIMILIAYQKVFDFTHNDLHTNNVMYISTTKKFLFYKYKNIYYKVPTFGRIYKIIDFGRAIYRVNGQRFVSDSFDAEGDACTQYNIEPFLDTSLPVMEPNYSFDLPRLACSLYELMEDEHPLKPLIVEWCKDDEGNSVLYDEQGEERYPGFKLYTMIAKTVSKHTPEMQLDRPEFKSYCTKGVKQFIDIDNLPLSLIHI